MSGVKSFVWKEIGRRERRKGKNELLLAM